jgi:hypothetical protein
VECHNFNANILYPNFLRAYLGKPEKKDYRSDDSEESCKLRCDIKYLSIAFDSSFQINLIINLKKTNRFARRCI